MDSDSSAKKNKPQDQMLSISNINKKSSFTASKTKEGPDGELTAFKQKKNLSD